MAATEVKVRMQQRRDTASGWTSANPVLLSGELGIETDTKKIKLGDGSTAWSALAYNPAFSISAHPLATADIADDAITAAKLANTTVTPGAYSAANIIVDAQGRITTALDGTIVTAQISNSAVTYAKIQDVSATDKILGRSSSGAGVVEEISCTSAGRALLDDADAAAQRTTLGLAIGTNVQAFDADTAKLDVAQTFTAAQTFNAGIDDADGSVRSVPQNAKTASYTLVAGDAGKHISITTGGITVPASVFSIGDAISIYNNSSSDQTITQGSSVTLRLAGDGTAGNKTLAGYGLVTVLCVASNVFVIAGAGLS